MDASGLESGAVVSAGAGVAAGSEAAGASWGGLGGLSEAVVGSLAASGAGAVV